MAELNWQTSRDLPSDSMAKSRGYVRARRVTLGDVVETDDGGLQANGSVQGTRKQPYVVDVDVFADKTGRVRVEGACSCPVGFNCKHVAALLTAARPRPGEQASRAKQADKAAHVDIADPANLPTAWRHVLQALSPDAQAGEGNARQRIVYILDTEQRPRGTCVTVYPLSVSVLKSGAWGNSEKPYDPGKVIRGQAAKFVTPADAEIMRVLAGDPDIDNQAFGAVSYHGGYRPYGVGQGPTALNAPTGPWLIRRMRETGRLYWRDHRTRDPLAAGPSRAMVSRWTHNADGSQVYTLAPEDDAAPGSAFTLLPLDPIHYVDPDANVIGVVEADVPPAVAARLLAAPPIQPAEAAALRAGLSERNVSLPALPSAPRERREERAEPVPVLRLTTARLLPGSGGLPWRAAYAAVGSNVTVACLAARYGNTTIDLDDGRETLQWLDGDELVVARRQREVERAWPRRLGAFGLATVYRSGTSAAYANPPQGYTFLDEAAREDADAWLRFVHDDLSTLEAEGWRVEIDATFPYNVQETDAAWTLEIDESGGTDWFGLTLGIDVDGTRMDLLPLVGALLRHFPMHGDSDAPAEDDFVYLRLDAQRVLALPADRAARIADALRGLFDRQPSDGAIALPSAELGELAAVDDVANRGDLAVQGGGDLRALARTLRDGGGLTATPVPAALEGNLRGYQQAGLDWLQTLARHGFGGILADDMGLGKTLQALAHVLAEKESGHLDRPCLLVAPTSVVWNWQNEAARFAPGLRVLVLHGPARGDSFDAIAEHDLVLTTYALLPRDASALRAHSYHFLICDEAQAVKNPDALAAKHLRQIDARQVICLTGTPVENHLDELWSLLRLTVPTLFGDRTAFRKHFRTPIEKHGDEERRAALARRVRPFLLRRTKEQVATELPARTETHEHVQLDGAQRDLYETVRVAMDKRVREEISKYGLARSQIAVLDALLKLRQVCCDPRLVKLDAAREVTTSAKLERLLAMLDDLVAEGRQVLVFSQFSSMLELIGDALKARGHAHAVLTGETRDRQTPVKRFQAGDLPIFLISLKAGGTGLNLTAADTVIHYDPWWNPAVEAQASDRAHRIGQDKPVFVYKMIAEGTVEERIVDMQARKRDLAALVQAAEDGSGPAISEADVATLLAPLED